MTHNKIAVIAGHILEDIVQVGIFRLPVGIRKDIILAYIIKHGFCSEAEEKIFILTPDEQEAIMQCVSEIRTVS